MSDADRIDAVERIVNLAMYLSAARAPVSWEEIRGDVAGYRSDQNREAFLRMFERDKKQLRESGLVITSDAEGRYLLDESATFATEITLSAEESAALGAAAASLVDDPAFPFSDDLRIALAKLGSSSGTAPCSAARIADEAPERQGRAAALVTEAAQRCKVVEFEYTTSVGERGTRHLEPYGAFVRDGRWYVVGRDTDRDAMRTFSLSRVENLVVNEAREATPDFERPDDFDITAYVMLPFQMGPDSFEAVLDFAPDLSWRVHTLVADSGTLVETDGGGLRWTVRASSRPRLGRWVIDNGPGIAITAPADLGTEIAAALDKVRADHA
jgi:proteasome accessory factor B